MFITPIELEKRKRLGRMLLLMTPRQEDEFDRFYPIQHGVPPLETDAAIEFAQKILDGEHHNK